MGEFGLTDLKLTSTFFVRRVLQEAPLSVNLPVFSRRARDLQS